ncbi:MAG TPA: nuclear transport factor 2 family protein [Pyrinomonadaceae bacterium]|nr:nuclear transport factor 2 family protein [Pyrinomonadaceae bacterium]
MGFPQVQEIQSPTTLTLDRVGGQTNRNTVRPVGRGDSADSHAPVQSSSNRTGIIVIAAIGGGILLLILGGLGSRLLFSESNRGADILTAEPTPTSSSVPELANEKLPNPTQEQPTPKHVEPLRNQSLKQEVTDALNGWAAAARERDLDQHMSYYADILDTYFTRHNVGANYVRASRTPAFTRYEKLDVQLSNIAVTIDASGTVATTTFDKTYRFEGEKTLSGSVQQMVVLTKISGRWRITSEQDLHVYYTNK